MTHHHLLCVTDAEEEKGSGRVCLPYCFGTGEHGGAGGADIVYDTNVLAEHVIMRPVTENA